MNNSRHPARTGDGVKGTVKGKSVLLRVDLNVPWRMAAQPTASTGLLKRLAPQPHRVIYDQGRKERRSAGAYFVPRPIGADPPQGLIAETCGWRLGAGVDQEAGGVSGTF